MFTKSAIIFISINIERDGAEKSLISLQNYFRSNKLIDTITIIPQKGLIEELLKQNNIPYIVHCFKNNINHGKGTRILHGLAKATINKLQAIRLSGKLRKDKVEVIGVCSNTITCDFGYYLAENLKVKHIWHVREIGKLDFGFDFELGFSFIKKMAAKSTKVICNSKAVMNYFSQYLDVSNLTFIYNGVPLKPSGVNDWNSEPFKMLLIGRLSAEKGQSTAVLACKKLIEDGINNFILDLYGTGVDYSILEKLICDNNLQEKVFLKGYANNIPINIYHAGLVCSKYEAFGRVTVEYMANGIPVLGTNSGGTPEIIRNGETGYLYKYNDFNALARLMEKLYRNREHCCQLGENGRQRAKLFSEERYCADIYRLYSNEFY